MENKYFIIKFNFFKKQRYKKLKNLGIDPTIVPPEDYSIRFKNFIENCFMESTIKNWLKLVNIKYNYIIYNYLIIDQIF